MFVRCIFVQPLHHENLVVWCAAASPRALLHYESLSTDTTGILGVKICQNAKKYTEQISGDLGGKSLKLLKSCRFPSGSAVERGLESLTEHGLFAG